MLLSFKILDSPGTKKDARHRKKTWEKNIVKKSGRASSSFDSPPRRGECWKEGKESCKPECWRPRQAERTEGVARPRPRAAECGDVAPQGADAAPQHFSTPAGCCRVEVWPLTRPFHVLPEKPNSECLCGNSPLKFFLIK